MIMLFYFLIYIIFLICLIDNPNKSKKPEPKIEYDDNIDYDGIARAGLKLFSTFYYFNGLKLMK